MKIEAHVDRGAKVIAVGETRLDAALAVEFKDHLRDMIADADGRVILDLGQVTCGDSSGLGAIVAGMKMTGKVGGLELSALQPNVLRVFQLTRMDSVFPIHANLDQALEGGSLAS